MPLCQAFYFHRGQRETTQPAFNSLFSNQNLGSLVFLETTVQEVGLLSLRTMLEVSQPPVKSGVINTFSQSVNHVFMEKKLTYRNYHLYGSVLLKIYIISSWGLSKILVLYCKTTICCNKQDTTSRYLLHQVLTGCLRRCLNVTS